MDEQQTGGWVEFGERTLYESRWVRLGLRDVRSPGGERFGYHVAHFPRIALALLLNPAGEVLLLWRYRLPIRRWGYELPGGLVEPDENPGAAAMRETVEETGWLPTGEATRLIEFEPLPGNVTAPMQVFLWRSFERVGEPTDPEEAGRVEWVPLSRAVELAGRDELLGAATAAALLYLHATTSGVAQSGG